MKYSLKELLRHQVAPALGCTEPISVALAAATAASLLSKKEIDFIEVWVDPNIYKNGMAVVIPRTGGITGLDIAAALGAFGGDPSLGMEVLRPANDDDLRQAVFFKKNGSVSINLLTDHRGICVQAKIMARNNIAEVEIRNFHDHIVKVFLNGRNIMNHPLLTKVAARSHSQDPFDVETWIKSLSLENLMSLLAQIDDDDRDFLYKGVTANMLLYEHGLKYGSGLGIGKTFDSLEKQKIIKKDMMLTARIMTSAAADARMAGSDLPAMSSAGSGNHGLTAVLPICAVKNCVNCKEESFIKALALSHMITAYIKAHTGRLSALCGCSIAAGAGAAAGVAHLLGGTRTQIASAIVNVLEDLAGVICDGAKASCALKLATAAGTAVQSALFALQGVSVQSTDGIVGLSPEETIQNIGVISTEGMIETDRTILKIMIQKKFSTHEACRN